MPSYDRHLRAARTISEAGGRLVGRTRLQKVVYLAQLAGFGSEFDFEYRHYGPFSEDLAAGMDIAAGLGIVTEAERRAEWGGRYSVYSATDLTPQATDPARARFVAEAAKIGPIELELAATAAFLYDVKGIGHRRGDPWEETAMLKPEKAGNGHLERAKAAYQKLRALETPAPLPEI